MADFDEGDKYRRPPPQWSRDAARSCPKVGRVPEDTANRGGLRFSRDGQRQGERGNEINSSKTATGSWKRPKQLPQPLSEGDEEDNIPYSQLPGKLMSKPLIKKQYAGSISPEELEHRKQLKERWNREYDKRVAAADSGDRSRDWTAATMEYYSDYLSSNEDGGPAGHRRYNDDAAAAQRYDSDDPDSTRRRRYTSQMVDSGPPRPLSASSYPYEADAADKEMDEPYHRQQQRYQPKHHHHHYPTHQPVAARPRYHPYHQGDVDDDPRDVDIRRLPPVVVSGGGVGPPPPSELPQSRSAYPQRQAADHKAARGSRRGHYRGSMAATPTAALAGPPAHPEQDGYISVEKRVGKTTFYHYEEENDEEEEGGRQGRGQDRSPSPLHRPPQRRELSRESISSATSVEGHQRPLPRSQSSRRREMAVKVEEQKQDSGRRVTGPRKKRPLSEHSSEEEEQGGWKEKQKLLKKRKTKKKLHRQRRPSESAQSGDGPSTSQSSSTSSRHSSVDRQLERQNIKQEKTAKAMEFNKKGTLLSKVTEILNSCMELKPPAKAAPKKAVGAATKQREANRKVVAAMAAAVVASGSQEKEAAQQKPQRPKQKMTNNNSTNSSQQAVKEEKFETADPPALGGQKQPPAPVPPPARLLAARPPLKTAAAEQRDEAVSTMDRPSLEDGEIHGTDADDTVNDVEDIFLDDPEPMEVDRGQLAGKKDKKVTYTVLSSIQGWAIFAVMFEYIRIEYCIFFLKFFFL